MRKRLFLSMGILPAVLLILFAGCSQLLSNIENDLKYWSSTVFVADTDIPSAGIDTEGYPCIASDGDKTITIKLINPQKYVIKMPQDEGAPYTV